MAAYKFRVSFEEDSDLVRDIEIKSESTFLQLHNTIIQAFEFTSNELASFYVSDDNWRKGQEISLEDMSDDDTEQETKALLMRKAILADFIEDPHQKFIYVFNFMQMWTFSVELIKIMPKEDPKVKYPVVVKREGDVPKMFKNIVPKHISDDEIDDDDSDLDGTAKNRKFNDDFDQDEAFDEDEYDGEFGHEDDEHGGGQTTGSYDDM